MNNTLRLGGAGLKKECVFCHQVFPAWKNDKFCSNLCYWRSPFKRKYTKETIITSIKELAKKLHRVPARRESRAISNGAIRLFGSWNKAVAAAGLEPNRSHDDRMYKRSMTVAVDGHTCDSVSEALIDNWLTEHGIRHERNVRYPGTKHLVDWKIGRDFVEYFGLAHDSGRYDKSIKEKILICKKAGIKLKTIYPSDLYPVNKIAEKFSFKFLETEKSSQMRNNP